MPAFDYTDFYILYEGHPRYDPIEIIEDEVLNVIVQKYEMILFTNQGEVLCEPNLGANLLELLYETKVSASTVKETLNSQIQRYIPEIGNIPYYLDVVFAQDPYSFQDVMFTRFQIKDVEVYAQIGNFT
jgi:hypothetical protein